MPTNILLVEDNPGDAIIFREKLNASDLDYKLAHAKRLNEGLERIRETDFDILLVDLSLPDAQGLEAVTRVREAAPNLPLIVLTGLDDATAAAEAKKQGAVDYLVKWYVDSVSLARYIRYAIAQYQMFGSGGSDEAGGEAASSSPARPSQPGRRGQVVEGTLVRQHDTESVEVETEVEAARATETAAVAETEAVTRGTTDAPPHAVRDALASAAVALLIVTEDGEVAFASDAAREWVPDNTYPWPVEEGTRHIPRKGRPLEQRASRTTWDGGDALLVTLSIAAPAPTPTPVSVGSVLEGTLLRTSEAALAFVELAEQRSAWMADVLRSALDLHRTASGEVNTQPGDLDALELAHQVTRDQRSLAMRYGLPLRAISSRKKVMVHTDRNLLSALLHRLIVDAIQAAGPDGVEVRVEVDRSESVVEAEWMESSRAADPAVEACASLGRGIVKHMAVLAGGGSHHERNAGGQHIVTVRLPSRSA